MLNVMPPMFRLVSLTTSVPPPPFTVKVAMSVLVPKRPSVEPGAAAGFQFRSLLQFKPLPPTQVALAARAMAGPNAQQATAPAITALRTARLLRNPRCQNDPDP